MYVFNSYDSLILSPITMHALQYIVYVENLVCNLFEYLVALLNEV